MNGHRRYAADFTDSLNSFCESSLTEKDSLDTNLDFAQIWSRDSLNTSNTSYTRDSLMSSDTLTEVSSASVRNDQRCNLFRSPLFENHRPETNKEVDLNKCINLFHNEITQDLTEDNKRKNKENLNPCQLLEESRDLDRQKDESLTNTQNERPIISVGLISPRKMKVSRDCGNTSKRDTNYNIRNSSFKSKSASKMSSPLTPKSDKVSNKTTVGSVTPNSKEKVGGSKKFDDLLSSLENELNFTKEKCELDSHILKRLSNTFTQSPKTFTERLVTIIEESVTSTDGELYKSGVNLSKLSKEFRSLCKYLDGKLIEDESFIEWPTLPFINVPSTHKENQTRDDTNIESLNNTTSPEKSAPSPKTPLADIMRNKRMRKVYRKTPKSVFRTKTISRLSNILSEECSPSFSNTNVSLNASSFECLEAQCEKLFSDKNDKPLRKSLSLPSLMSMEDILAACEKQMASLDESPEKSEGNKMSERRQSKQLKNHSPQKTAISGTKLSCSKRNSSNRKLRPEPSPQKMLTPPDELEKTLLAEIAEKRQRCLDTAKAMMEINFEQTQIRESVGMFPKLDSPEALDTLDTNDIKFLNTLMSCKKYHAYLEEHKPLLNLLQSKETATKTNEAKLPKNPETKKPSVTTIQTSTARLFNTPRSSSVVKNGNNRMNLKFGAKPKLFVTPGKTVQTKCYKKKGEYFPNMESNPKKPIEQNIIKSPHVNGLYRLNYNTVMSPVGMYIRGGTAPRVAQNIRPKTDNKLTPMKKEAKIPSTPVPRFTSSKHFQEPSKPQKVIPKLFMTPSHNAEEMSARKWT